LGRTRSTGGRDDKRMQNFSPETSR